MKRPYYHIPGRVVRAIGALSIVLTVVSAATIGHSEEPQGGFVTAVGTKLKLNGGDFYFSGANSYSMLYSESDAEEQFEIAAELGLNAIRLWGFWNGEDLNPQLNDEGEVIRPGTRETDIYGHYVLQPRPGEFSDEAWGDSIT